MSATDASFEQEVLELTRPSPSTSKGRCPCRMIGPLAGRHRQGDGRQACWVVKVNIDENPMALTRYGVRSIPTLLLFKNGQVAATKIGAEPKQKLVSWINTVVRSAGSSRCGL